jgi:uncharacterized protein YndB with AHSA1/START domain
VGTLEHAVWIQAPPDAVWSVYVDPSRIPDWQTGSPVIEDVRGSGGAPGSTYISRRGPGAATTTVLEAERPRRLVTETHAYLGLRFTVVSTLEALEGGTRLRLRVETHWPRGLGLLGKLVELAVLGGREAEKELGRLKALVESRSPGPDESP